MTSPISLTLETTQAPRHVDELNRDLLRDLQRQPGLDAREATRPEAQGERSVDVSLVGQIILTFLSAGTATALIGCLKAYVERDHHLKFRLKRSDGAELELDGAALDHTAIKESVQVLERFIAP